MLHEKETKIQLAEANNHRINAAEPAVKSTKYHTIAHFSTLDPECPVQLWCKMLEQVEDTLNLLRTSRRNPKILAYEELNGPFDWNKTPIAPLGTRALAFLDPDTRNSWQAHKVDIWYVGRAKYHYCLLQFFDPQTGG